MWMFIWLLCLTKLLDKKNSRACLSCPHDPLEHRQVFLECFLPLFRQGVARLRTVLHFLDKGDQSRLMQRAEVRDQVAVAHLEFRLQILERPTGSCGQEGHDREPSTLVNRLIQFAEIKHAKCLLDRKWTT